MSHPDTHDLGDANKTPLVPYKPPTAPPSNEVLDSMPRWEYDWWQGWIERHALPRPRQPFRAP